MRHAERDPRGVLLQPRPEHIPTHSHFHTCRFRCNVCGMLNEIPVEYFCNLDQNGRRKDLDERPELSQGTVEYVAPAGEREGGREGGRAPQGP